MTVVTHNTHTHTHSLTHTHPFTHLHTHSLTHSLTHSFAHCLTHSLFLQLIYADLKFVSGSADAAQPSGGSRGGAGSNASGVRGDRVEESHYAGVDQFQTLLAQQESEGRANVLSQKEVEYQNVDDLSA